jgi:hypothetical protein
MQRRLYAIIIYNIRKTDINIITDIKIIIRIIQAENRPLYGFLNLYRIAWPRQVRKIEKTYGFLIIKIIIITAREKRPQSRSIISIRNLEYKVEEEKKRR